LQINGLLHQGPEVAEILDDAPDCMGTPTMQCEGEKVQLFELTKIDLKRLACLFPCNKIGGLFLKDESPT